MNTMDSALGCEIESILSQLGYGEFVKRTNDMLRRDPTRIGHVCEATYHSPAMQQGESSTSQ